VVSIHEQELEAWPAEQGTTTRVRCARLADLLRLTLFDLVRSEGPALGTRPFASLATAP
jgi:hypothetical protein